MERGKGRGRFRGQRRGQNRVEGADYRESQNVNNENVGQPKSDNFSVKTERGHNRGGRFRGQRRGTSSVGAANYRETQNVNNGNVSQPKSDSFSVDSGRGQNRGRFRGQNRVVVQAANQESQNENLGQPKSGNNGYHRHNDRVK